MRDVRDEHLAILMLRVEPRLLIVIRQRPFGFVILPDVLDQHLLFGRVAVLLRLEVEVVPKVEVELLDRVGAPPLLGCKGSCEQGGQ